MATAGALRGSDRTAARSAKTPAQVFAYVTGAVLLLVGLIGFAADGSFTTGDGIDGGKLLGIFEVNGIHNLVHIASGLLLLAVAPKRASARAGAIAFGLAYGLVTLIGLIDGVDVLGLLPVNGADNVLHIALTAAALLAGFSSRGDDARGRRDRTVG